MKDFLVYYQPVDPTTWVYLSSLLMIGLFFKFSRFWSVRNLDLILLAMLSPGLLLVHQGQQQQLDAWAQRSRLDALDQAPETPASQADAAAANDAAGAVGTDSDRTATNQTDVDPADQVPSDTDRAAAERADADRALAVAEEASLTEITTLAADGLDRERLGFIWLFSVAGVLLLRLLVDPTMVRRPLLEPNLSTGGLTFIGCSLFIFLMANVFTSQPTADDLEGPMRAARIMSGARMDDDREASFKRYGPGYALIFMLPSIPTVNLSATVDRQPVANAGARQRHWTFVEEGRQQTVTAEFQGVTSDDKLRLLQSDGQEKTLPLSTLSESDQQLVRLLRAYTAVAKTMAIFSHLIIVLGIVAIGYWHFENIKMGIGAATLYLMLPYTSQMTGRVDHVLPAALLTMAILFYRRPLTCGFFVGLATGVVYYPLFLLPLWISFYWQRGLMRFVIGVVSMLAIMAVMLLFFSSDASSFVTQLKEMFGIMVPQDTGLLGIWRLGWEPVYRFPVLAAFIALSGTLAIWPAQKNLGTLLSCSAAVMVATQFWHGYGGGLYVGWYLPLLLLTIFRPNLEDRVALSVLGDGWVARRRALTAMVKAA